MQKKETLTKQWLTPSHETWERKEVRKTKHKTEQELNKHEETVVNDVKETVTKKAVTFFTGAIQKVKDMITGAEATERTQEAEANKDHIAPQALDRINNYIEQNEQLTTIFDAMIPIFCEKDDDEKEQAYTQRKRKLAIAYFLWLDKREAQYEIESYLTLHNLVSDVIQGDETESTQKQKTAQQKEIKETKKIFSQLYHIHHSFGQACKNEKTDRKTRSPSSPNKTQEPKKRQRLDHLQRKKKTEQQEIPNLWNKHIISPDQMATLADPYEKQWGTTYCSRTARENADRIFHTAIPQANAYDAIQKQPLGNYTHTVQTQNTPIDLPQYGETNIVDDMKKLPTPNKEYPGTVIDLGIQSKSQYWHRALWYFDFSSDQRMVLDPYRSQNKSTKPIELSTYASNNNVFCARFYTSDYIVGRPQEKHNQKEKQTV